MFEKTKKFCKENAGLVLSIGGTVVIVTTAILLGSKNTPKRSRINAITSEPFNDEEDRMILQDYGAVYKAESEVPFATEEIATKFMKERGDTYQLDILDKDTSVVWISRCNEEG